MLWLSKDPWFTAEPLEKPKPVHNGWTLAQPQAPQAPIVPVWADDKEKKTVFAKRLAKGDKPYDAAVFATGNNADGLWALSNWLRDPFVVLEREAAEAEINLLDKDQLSVKLLRFADEKTQSGQPLHESKDRIAALKLYAEIQGMIGNNVNVDLSKTINNDNRVARITFVNPNSEPEKPTKIIEHPRKEIEPLKGINLKLVG